MILLSKSDAIGQISELLNHYPHLSVVETNESYIQLQGDIDVYRMANGFVLDKTYNVEIKIPINSSKLPTISDLGGAIDSSYQHRYITGELCLETETAILWRFINGFYLIEWVDEYVEPYFFTYEYFKRYGTFPFGERPHGIEGIINTYQDLMKEPDVKLVLTLMRFCADEKYRGHVKCPCGSGEKLRRCHGDKVFPFMSNPSKQEIIKLDVERIREEIDLYESSRKNLQPSKHERNA